LTFLFVTFSDKITRNICWKAHCICFCGLLLSVHAHLWRIRELYSVGVWSGNSSATCSRQGVSTLWGVSRDIINDITGKQLESQQIGCGISSWSWSPRRWSRILRGKDIWFSCAWTWSLFQ
jgi:hypothetical protein